MIWRACGARSGCSWDDGPADRPAQRHGHPPVGRDAPGHGRGRGGRRRAGRRPHHAPAGARHRRPARLGGRAVLPLRHAGERDRHRAVHPARNRAGAGSERPPGHLRAGRRGGPVGGPDPPRRNPGRPAHCAAGGRVLPLEEMAAIVAAAQQAGLAVHLDGARLWNAAAALGVAPARVVRGATTVMVSFSKGLGCPVGSCLAFAGARRAEAWEVRKRLGGGMRQSGILAAAGLYALEHHLPELGRDHERARLLADRLAGLAAVSVIAPETNIVMLDLTREGDTAARVAPRLAAAGLLVATYGPRRLRAVTHRDVGTDDVERAAGILRSVLE